MRTSMTLLWILGLALGAGALRAGDACDLLPYESWEHPLKVHPDNREMRYRLQVSAEALAYWRGREDRGPQASRRPYFWRFGEDPEEVGDLQDTRSVEARELLLAGTEFYLLEGAGGGPYGLTTVGLDRRRSLEGRYTSLEAAGELGVLARDEAGRLTLVSTRRSSVPLERVVPQLRPRACEDADTCPPSAVARARTAGHDLWLQTTRGPWLHLAFEEAAVRVREVPSRTRRGRALESLVMIGSGRAPFGLGEGGLWRPAGPRGFRRALHADDFPEDSLRDPGRWFADVLTGELWARGERALYRLDPEERELVRAASLPADPEDIESVHARAGVLFAWVHQRGLLKLSTRCEGDDARRAAFRTLHAVP